MLRSPIIIQWLALFDTRGQINELKGNKFWSPWYTVICCWNQSTKFRTVYTGMAFVHSFKELGIKSLRNSGKPLVSQSKRVLPKFWNILERRSVRQNSSWLVGVIALQFWDRRQNVLKRQDSTKDNHVDLFFFFISLFIHSSNSFSFCSSTHPIIHLLNSHSTLTTTAGARGLFWTWCFLLMSFQTVALVFWNLWQLP